MYHWYTRSKLPLLLRLICWRLRYSPHQANGVLTLWWAPPSAWACRCATGVGGSDDKTTLPLIDTPDEVFRSQLELNLTTAFQGCKAAAKRMGDWGSIINISSGAGTRGSPFTGPYAAAKAGMNNLTQTLALELAPRIRVNAVAPGPVATEAFLEILNVGDQLDQLAATIPLGRLGAPDDIADATIFLASDAASWITGQLLLVAGGRTERSYQYRPKDGT